MKQKANADVFNIDLYVQNNKYLYTRFDILVGDNYCIDSILKLQELGRIASKYAARNLTGEDRKEDNTEIYDIKILQHLLQMQDATQDLNSDSCTKSKYMLDGSPLTHIEIVYKMTITPSALINWFACFTTFINQNNGTLPRYICYGSHGPLKKLVQIDDIHALPNRENWSGGLTVKLMEKMVAFQKFQPELEEYKDALAALEKVYRIYSASRKSANPRPLLEFLSDSKRCDLFYQDAFNKIASPVTPAERDESILSIVANMIAQRAECLFMLELINAKNKIEFILPCIDKLADDKQPFHMGHTELMFLYFAQFRLFPNQQIGIINFDSNPIYLQFYAPGKPYPHLLHRELCHWASLMGLEFEPCDDFHQKKIIMFTAESSEKIRHYNLHLDGIYGKTFFNIYNTWAFYTRISMNDNQGNLLGLLPKEILDDILIKANPSFQHLSNHNHEIGFFHAVRLGRERGVAEHKAVLVRKTESEFTMC